MGGISLLLVEERFLRDLEKKELSKTRMREWEIFICMKLYPLVSKVPFPLNQSW